MFLGKDENIIYDFPKQNIVVGNLTLATPKVKPTLKQKIDKEKRRKSAPKIDDF